MPHAVRAAHETYEWLRGYHNRLEVEKDAGQAAKALRIGEKIGIRTAMDVLVANFNLKREH